MLSFVESLDEDDVLALGIEVAFVVRAVDAVHALIVVVEGNGDAVPGQCPVRRRPIAADLQTQAQMQQRVVLGGPCLSWAVDDDLSDLQILALESMPEMAMVCRGWGIGRRQDEVRR